MDTRIARPVLGVRRWLSVLCVAVATAGIARAQFQPAIGPVNTPVSFSAATSGGNGSHTLTRSGNTVTVTRTTGLPDLVFTCQPILGATTEQLFWSFPTAHGVVIRCSSSTNIMVKSSLHFARLDRVEPVVLFYSREDSDTQQPNAQLSQSSDGLVLFSRFTLNVSAANDTFELMARRGDTGAFLCGKQPHNSDPGDSTTASVDATSVSIVWNRASFPDVTNSCLLPVAELTLTPPMLDFGLVVNTTNPTDTVTFANPGSDELEVTGIAATTHFSAPGFTPFTLAPGGSQAVTVQFNPANPPGSTATIQEDLLITRTPPVGPDSIACAGQSRDPVPGFTATPDPIAFGIVDVGSTGTVSLTIANPGDVALAITSASAPANAEYGFPANLSGAGIPAGGSQAFAFTFTPTGAGALPDSVVIGTNDPGTPHTIPITGTGRIPAPVISVVPTTLAFGTVNVGTASPLALTVSNPGQLPLNILPATTAPAFAEYSIAPALVGATIAPGASQVFAVTLTPTLEVSYADSFTIASNDPALPAVLISLTGMGHIPVPIFVLDPTLTELNYGEVELDYVFAKGVRVRNDGDALLEFDVEITGDGRFSFSEDPLQPGVGVRGPTHVQVPPGDEKLFRVTFQASGPVGGPYLGDFAFSGINDLTVAVAPSIDLEGSVIPGKTLDIVLALDRSGSMSDPTADGDKVTTLRKASTLFLNLLRTNGLDRAALVQYNTQADLLRGIEFLDVPTRDAFVDEINDPTNLVPSGATSITAGLLEAFDEVNDPNRDVRAVLIVSDGEENTPATLPDGSQVTLSNVTIPSGVGVHSLALGRAIDVDLARLEDVANRSGGTSEYTGDLQGLTAFDVEKFFLQVATTILGQTPVLDPVYTIAPGEVQTIPIPLIAADKEVTFVLVFKDGVLPYRVIGPNGNQFPAGSPPFGIGQLASDLPNARVLRLRMPTDHPELYVGNWYLEVRHGGKLLHLGGRDDHPTTSSAKDPVPYALAVSVASDLRILGLVSPEPKYVGDRIQLTAFLTEEGIPVTGASIEVTTTRPNGSVLPALPIYDDGAHGDGDADDGEYGVEFTDTAMAGGYSFRFHAVGTSLRGGTFVREASAGKTVLSHTIGEDPEDEDPGGGGGFEECCKTLGFWLKLIALLLLVLIVLTYLCCRRKTLVATTTHQAIAQPPH